MPTLRNVMDLVDQKGYVTVESLQRELSLPEDQACRVLKACWDRGLLMPMTTSFFARPVDGSAPKLRGGKGRTEWHTPNIKRVGQLIEERDMGVASSDVCQALDISRGTAVAVLKLMTDRDQLIERKSSYGGAFGNQPTIWGRDEQDILRREALFRQRVAEVKAQRREQRRSNARAGVKEERWAPAPGQRVVGLHREGE